MKLSEDLNELHGRLADGDLMIPGTDWVREMADHAEALEAVAEAAQDVTKHTKLIGLGITETNFAAMQELTDALDHLQELSDD